MAKAKDAIGRTPHSIFKLLLKYFGVIGFRVEILLFSQTIIPFSSLIVLLQPV